MDAKSLRQFRFLVGGVNKEWGQTQLLPAGSAVEDDTTVPILLNFLAAGLVPPFSDFFLAVWSTTGSTCCTFIQTQC